MNTDTRILSVTAFALFIFGVFAPFITAFGSDVGIIVAMVATVLALILGFLGRSFLLGKVAAAGALIVCVLGGTNYLLFRTQRAAAKLRIEQEFNRAQRR